NLMIERIWIMVERALWRAFFGPCLQGGQLLECRQIVTAAGRNKLCDRFRLRQIDEQALCSFLVLGKIPRRPEERQERCKAAFRTRWKSMSPALLRNLRRIAFGDCPCARRIHDQCALA